MSWCHPSHLLSKSSYSSPYISPLPPLYFYRLTPNHPHSYAPDAQATSICHASPHPPHSVYPRVYKSTLRFLSFSDTPHIYLTIICSVLSRLCRFSAFITHVSVPYVNKRWSQALYIFSFMWYDAPRAVRIGDNSLNLAQAHLTLALAASSTRTKCVAQITKLGNTFHLPHWVQSQPLSALLFNFPEMPLHLLLTYLRHSMHKIELLLTPFLQTPHGFTPESSTWPLLTSLFPAFTLRPSPSPSIFSPSPVIIPLFLQSEQDRLHKAVP